MIADKSKINRTTPGTPRSSKTPPPEMDHDPGSGSELEAEEEARPSKRTRKPARVLTSPSYITTTPPTTKASQSNQSPTISPRRLEYNSDESTQLVSSSSGSSFHTDITETNDEDEETEPATPNRSPQSLHHSDSENDSSASQQLRINTRAKGKQKQSSSRGKGKDKNSPSEEDLFDMDELDNINIDDINDPAVVAAIAKSKRQRLKVEEQMF